MRILYGLLLSIFLVPTTALAQEDEKQAEIARAQFTSEVVNREPVDQLFQVPSDVRQIYFFTDLRNLAGQTLTHQWLYGGEVMAEISFNVGADRWRVWSSKNLIPEWQGDWKVVVVDGLGTVLHEDTVIYGE